MQVELIGCSDVFYSSTIGYTRLYPQPLDHESLGLIRCTTQTIPYPPPPADVVYNHKCHLSSVSACTYPISFNLADSEEVVSFLRNFCHHITGSLKWKSTINREMGKNVTFQPNSFVFVFWRNPQRIARHFECENGPGRWGIRPTILDKSVGTLLGLSLKSPPLPWINVETWFLGHAVLGWVNITWLGGVSHPSRWKWLIFYCVFFHEVVK